MTTREKAHQLLEDLPDTELEPVIEFISAREDPVRRMLDGAPVDDEPFTKEDGSALDEAYAELDRGEPTMSVAEFRDRYA